MTTSTGQVFSPIMPAPSTPARSLAAGEPARAGLDEALADLRRRGRDVPTIVDGRERRSGTTHTVRAPHDHSLELGTVHHATQQDVEHAIDTAVAATADWGRWPQTARAEVFARAADLMTKPPWRDRLVAAAMVELSKTAEQAEGDVICEAVDFIRANLANAALMESIQPASPEGAANHVEYRPLEGFVLAVSPFNFASMSNLALGPALLGNGVLWKPAESAALTASLVHAVLEEAGLPAGVVNVVHGHGPTIGAVALAHPDLAAVHFTGSTATFQDLWQTVGRNVTGYRNYPRIVGETGGKDFVVAHSSADLESLAVACVMGAYDYQGQKCAAASRLYVPRSLWPRLRDLVVELTSQLRMGDPAQPGVQLGAVIDERQFRKHEAALEEARHKGVVVAGGATDGAHGWFVEPTLLEVDDPMSPFLTEELFAPVLAAYVYDDAEWPQILGLVDESTVYGLTGSIFAEDEDAIASATDVLRYAAGNLYVNDRPTGAVVGQQPFGGSRASGTNDKAGSVWNLIRFVSPRSVKRNFSPPRSL